MKKILFFFLFTFALLPTAQKKIPKIDQATLRSINEDIAPVPKKIKIKRKSLGRRIFQRYLSIWCINLPEAEETEYLSTSVYGINSPNGTSVHVETFNFGDEDE